MALRLVVSAIVLFPAVWFGASASAASDYTLELRIEGTSVAVVITQVTTPLGALEIEIAGLAPLTADCELSTGFGACRQTDGFVQLSAINPTGWAEPQELMSAEMLSGVVDPAHVQLKIRQGTDINGIDLVGLTSSVVGDSAANGKGSGSGTIILAAVVGIAAIGIALLATQRYRSSRSAVTSTN